MFVHEILRESILMKLSVRVHHFNVFKCCLLRCLEGHERMVYKTGKLTNCRDIDHLTVVSLSAAL